MSQWEQLSLLTYRDFIRKQILKFIILIHKNLPNVQFI